MNTDGSGLTRLTYDPPSHWFASWSPDGNRLAFQSGTIGRHDIFVMNKDGSGLSRLTYHPADDRYPTWSEDGTRIAFASFRNGNWELYTVQSQRVRPHSPYTDIVPLTTIQPGAPLPATGRKHLLPLLHSLRPTRLAPRFNSIGRPSPAQHAMNCGPGMASGITTLTGSRSADTTLPAQHSTIRDSIWSKPTSTGSAP